MGVKGTTSYEFTIMRAGQCAMSHELPGVVTAFLV